MQLTEIPAKRLRLGLVRYFGAVRPLSVWGRYLFAVAAPTVSAALSLTLGRAWEARLPFVFFYPAVMASSWLGGFWPGMLTTSLSTLIAALQWNAPERSFAVAGWSELLALGIFVAICGLICGINEAWRRAAGQAAESETRLRTLLEQLRLSLSVGHMRTWEYTLESGALQWSSDADASPSERSPTSSIHELHGRVHEGDRLRVAHVLKDAVARRSGYVVEYRVPDASGGCRWVEERGQVVCDTAGRPRRVIGVSLDVTERKQTEDTFRVALEAAPAAMLMVNDSGSIVHANALTETLFGYPRSELVGRTVEQLLPARVRTDHAGHRQRFLEDRRQRPMGAGRELYASRKDGSEVPVEIGLSPIETGLGRFVLAAVTDVTERRKAEDALRTADRRKDEFLAMLSHELRNPLGAITNAVQLQQKLASSHGTWSWATGVIARQVAHLTRIVEDLLDVSRISRGQLVVRKEPLLLTQAVELALEAVQPAIEARRQVLTSALPHEPVWLEGDATRLAQVIGNLLSNACKFTPLGGSITFSVEREEKSVVIRVRDDGVGIAPEMLTRIFDMFVQTDRPVDSPPGGLGLGLTLARQLARMHGGDLHAISDGPGRGSEFVLRLPIVDGVAAPPAAASQPMAGASVRRRILVVDDNADAAESLALALGLAGHEVRTAADGPSALMAVAEFRPDVLLLDIGLPGMDGYEVARQLRTRGTDRELTLVALTGYASEADKRRSREAGFDHHLTKPVGPDSVVALLDELRPNSMP